MAERLGDIPGGTEYGFVPEIPGEGPASAPNFYNPSNQGGGVAPYGWEGSVGVSDPTSQNANTRSMKAADENMTSEEAFFSDSF